MEILPPLSEEDRMLSGLCYPFWPLVPPMVLLGARREEPFVHFHALQALALGFLSTGGCLFLAGLVWLTLKVLPGGSPTFSGIVGLGVFSAGFFVLAFYISFLLYTAWRAGDGRFLRLPFVGAWAEARMQANLGLGPEDYSVEPLPARSQGVPSEPRETAVRPSDAERLTRLHRPAATPGRTQAPVTPSRPRLLALQEREESPAPAPGFEPRPEAPEAAVEGAEEEGFQPGLFPGSKLTASRQFRWEALDQEE